MVLLKQHMLKLSPPVVNGDELSREGQEGKGIVQSSDWVSKVDYVWIVEGIIVTCSSLDT